jgi:hypothetical protein
MSITDAHAPLVESLTSGFATRGAGACLVLHETAIVTGAASAWPAQRAMRRKR